MFKSINGIEVIDLERIITPDEILEDGNSELSLRPQKINEYIGQDKVKDSSISLLYELYNKFDTDSIKTSPFLKTTFPSGYSIFSVATT